MKKIALFTTYCLLTTHFLFSQNLERARQTIDSLCSPAMFGRGASFDGQKLAADYLANQFSVIGIKPVNKNYFQFFNYPINTFPKNLLLKIDTVTLQPGKDYIVQADAPSSKGELSILILDSLSTSTKKKVTRLLKKSFLANALVVNANFKKKLSPLLLEKLKEAPLILEIEEKKLTMGLAASQKRNPSFSILPNPLLKNGSKVTFEIEAELIPNYKAQNICGSITGTQQPDSFVFITAHYDHLGTLGKAAYFPGANDNGSGVSMLLEFAHYYIKNPPAYSIVFIAFGAEEAGLIGSNYFTKNPLIPLSSIKFLLNLDLMGTGEDGMMVVNGTVFPKEFEILSIINKRTNYLREIKKRGKAANSDHYYFTEKGVPSFFFYTLGGVSAYHDIYDLPGTLPLTKYQNVFNLITEFIALLSLN